ncbi:MAG: DNA adenine methylase [Bryobacteraceae bacterium]|jgi:DNA adenine methylase
MAESSPGLREYSKEETAKADMLDQMRVPHPVPYQGSKRKLTPAILACFPLGSPRLIEPFAGSAAVTLAAAAREKASRFVIADLNAPLMDLWRAMIENPDEITDQYRKLWHDQAGREREFYDRVRDQFNKIHEPGHLLYLLLRCVKAAVRYNANGDFNQSPDNRRRGMNPETLRDEIAGASRLLKGKTQVVAGDYREVLEDARPEDIVYIDPPYQGVCGDGDGRYIKGLSFEDFTLELRKLNERQVSYILSYDGRANDKVYGKPMPEDLNLFRIELDAGRSTQATFLGKDVTTYESLYLSPALAERTGKVDTSHLTRRGQQTTLLDDSPVIEWARNPIYQKSF